MREKQGGRGIDLITARPGRSCYGMGLGVIILDDVYPGFPGDVRNATSYPYNVQFEIVQGVDIQRLVFSKDKSPCLDPILQAALNLEKKGCRAISAECGYFAYFQKEIAARLQVPIFMSSLLQVPWAQQVISPQQVVGIFVGSKQAVSIEHLMAVGISPDSNYVIEGAVDDGLCKEFENLWIEGRRPELPRASYEKAKKEFLGASGAFFQSHSNMGAMVLECTGFPPFARALQREIDIPVFSYSTLLDFAYSVAVHRDFCGHV